MKNPRAHAIRWEYDNRGVTGTAICHEPDGADCRLTGVSCECEVWGEIRRTDGKIFHRIIGGTETEPQWHEVKPAGYCNICLFLNESGEIEELGHGSFVIAETPIAPYWGDGYEWSPVLGDGQ